MSLGQSGFVPGTIRFVPGTIPGSFQGQPDQEVYVYVRLFFCSFGYVLSIFRSLGNGVRKHGVRHRCPYRRCGVDTEIPYRPPFWREFCWVLPVCVASRVDTEFPYRVCIVDRGVDSCEPFCRHHFDFLGCRKWGCNKWGLKGCLAALPGNRPKSAKIALILPFSPFSGGSQEHLENPGFLRKKAFFLRYPRISLNPHLLNPHLRHSKF